jgi:hypothetical protein
VKKLRKSWADINKVNDEHDFDKPVAGTDTLRLRMLSSPLVADMDLFSQPIIQAPRAGARRLGMLD